MTPINDEAAEVTVTVDQLVASSLSLSLYYSRHDANHEYFDDADTDTFGEDPWGNQLPPDSESVSISPVVPNKRRRVGLV